MKNEKWLTIVIVVFTSLTTVLLLADNTVVGFVRAIVSAAILDGLIMYWDEKRTSLKDDNQRKIANGMMWAGVGMMLMFAVGYGIESFAPEGAIQTVDIFGYKFSITLTEFIIMLATSMIGMWVVATLGVVLYLRQIDPDILNDLANTKSVEEAEAERRKEEQQAYKTAMKVTSRTVGTEKALRMFRANLLAMDYYQPYEIDRMVDEAAKQIDASRSGLSQMPTQNHALPTLQPAMLTNQATVDGVELANPTNANTHK